MFTPLKKQIKSSVLAIINTFNNAQQQIQTIFSADEGLGLKCVCFCLLLHVIRNNIILDCECWRFHLLLCFWVGTHNTYKTFKSSPPFLFSYYLWGKLVLQIRNHPSCTHATGYCAKQLQVFLSVYEQPAEHRQRQRMMTDDSLQVKIKSRWHFNNASILLSLPLQNTTKRAATTATSNSMAGPTFKQASDGV